MTRGGAKELLILAITQVLPEVKRIIYIPGVTQVQRAQALIDDLIDGAAMSNVYLIKETLDQNIDLITHSGRDKPYGYVDWWPESIAFNTSGKFGPYDNPDVRWAVSFYLDRDELREIAYDGASSLNPLTMPQYPPLQPYFDIAAEVIWLKSAVRRSITIRTAATNSLQTLASRRTPTVFGRTVVGTRSAAKSSVSTRGLTSDQQLLSS